MRTASDGLQPIHSARAPTSTRTINASRYWTSMSGTRAQLRRDRARARDAGDERACCDERCGGEQGVAFAMPERFDGGGDTGHRQYRHALLLRHDAAEILHDSERAAEHAHIGRADREYGAKPAEPRRTAGIACRDDEQ